MKEIHAHEVLRMMEGNNYTEETLYNAIIEKFGNDTRFHTCSALDLDANQIINFLRLKGKFKASDNGFTMDINKVCSTY